MQRFIGALGAIALSSQGGLAVAATGVPLPPLDQVEKNVVAFMHEHPDDADAQYVVARLHYLSYVAQRTGSPGTARTALANQYALEDAASLPRSDHVDAPQALEARRHLVRDAIRDLREAIQRNDKAALYHLTLAAVLDYAASDDQLTSVGNDPLPPADAAHQRKIFPATRKRFDALLEAAHPAKGPADAAASNALRQESCFGLRVLQRMSSDSASAKSELAPQRERCWFDRAAEEYWQALQIESRVNATTRLPSSIAQHAATGYDRIAKDKGGRESADRVAWIEANRSWFTARPPPESMNAVVVSPAGMAAEELTSQTSVSFDADGCGARDWNWIRPEVGVLAWAPDGSGIVAPWQILGSSWLFMRWPTGYRALDALDTNRDGVLSGDELKGLGVWVDKQSDGRCEAGEVKPLSELGIVEIAVHSTSVVGGVSANLQGIKLRDGRTLPTYGWTPQLASSVARAP